MSIEVVLRSIEGIGGHCNNIILICIERQGHCGCIVGHWRALESIGEHGRAL